METENAILYQKMMYIRYNYDQMKKVLCSFDKGPTEKFETKKIYEKKNCF